MNRLLVCSVALSGSLRVSSIGITECRLLWKIPGESNYMKTICVYAHEQNTSKPEIERQDAVVIDFDCFYVSKFDLLTTGIERHNCFGERLRRFERWRPNGHLTRPQITRTLGRKYTWLIGSDYSQLFNSAAKRNVAQDLSSGVRVCLSSIRLSRNPLMKSLWSALFGRSAGVDTSLVCTRCSFRFRFSARNVWK